VSGKISVSSQQEENCYPPFSEGNYYQEGRIKNECAEQSSHCPVGDLLKDGDK